MTKDDIKNIKLNDLSGLKSTIESFNKIKKMPNLSPNLDIFVDSKIKMLSNIEQDTEKIKENTKFPFWKSLLVSMIGGIIGGSIPYLLALIFG